MSTKKVSLPAGFKAIGGFGGDSWQPKKPGDTVQGKFVGTKKVKVPKKGKREGYERNLHTIATKTGDVQVWQSAGLRALESVKKGTQVAIVYLGKKKIPGQVQPMRDYAVGTK